MPSTGIQNTIAQPIYDTVQVPVIAAAGGGINLFVTGLGSPLTAAIAKTSVHTNLQQDGRLEAGVSMTLTAISMHFRQLAAGAVRPLVINIRAIRGGCFILELGQREFLKVPIASIPNGGANLVLFSNIVAAATEWDYCNGVPVVQNRYLLDPPLEVDSLESILVRLTNFNIVTAVTDVTVVLWGTMTRPAR